MKVFSISAYIAISISQSFFEGIKADKRHSERLVPTFHGMEAEPKLKNLRMKGPRSTTGYKRAEVSGCTDQGYFPSPQRLDTTKHSRGAGLPAMLRVPLQFPVL